MRIRFLADSLLHALAESDIERVKAGCREDVVVFGTDIDEEWHDRDTLVASLVPFAGTSMSAEWESDPATGTDWVAGTAIYSLADGSLAPVRVSMIFTDGLLVHGHFSVATPERLVAPIN